MSIKKHIIVMALLGVYCLIMGSCQTRPAHAEGLEPGKVLIGIVGEAGGLGIDEQEAIGRAIINRGTFKGVYGYDRASKAIIGLKTRQKAQKALNQAIRRDITGGATHWLSRWDLKHCRPSLIAWRKKMKVALVTKHFTFYKGEA